MRRILLLVTLALQPALASAQGGPNPPAPSHGGHATLAYPDHIEWKPAPPSLPAGAQVAVLEGDPSQPGPFTMRLRLPDGYRIPPHHHPGQERITVISGTFVVGMGERFEAGKGTELIPGSYASMPPRTAHFAWARGETVVQLNNVGPWSLVYVDPADDPRNQPR